MSDRLLVQLEVKIDDMIDTLQILRLQVSDLEEKNGTLQTENTALKTRQTQWEQGLTTLLNKLDDVNPSSSEEALEIENFEHEVEEVFE